MGRKKTKGIEETTFEDEIIVIKGIKNVRFTKTEARIMDLLSDGEPHSPDDLIKVLYDDQGSRNTVAVHINNIRKKIGGSRHWIICERSRQRKLYYRRIIKYYPPNE